jgi:hypothetical protein
MGRRRYEVLKVLQDGGFDPCLWSEDALAYYGVPTVVFELYILLPDSSLESAKSLLEGTPDYVLFPSAPGTQLTGLPYFLPYDSYRFKEPESEIGIQLLPSEEFAQFTISEKTTVREEQLLFPRLSDFIDALVYQYLRPAQTDAEFEYRAHLGVHLFYLGDYAPAREDILSMLSPRAHKVWRDILRSEFVFGDAGVEYYNNIEG